MPDADTPRESRESVFLSATVTQFGQAAPSKHRVRNLSANGACIDQAAALKAGQTVLLEVGTLEEVGATVRWVTGDLAGLQFAHAIALTDAKARAKPAHVRQGWNGAAWSGAGAKR